MTELSTASAPGKPGQDEARLASDAEQSSANAARLSHITRNTLVVAACFGLAAMAGLVRNIVIAQTFGIGAALDLPQLGHMR